MRIEIEIPKNFEEHFNQDKFKDSFERIMADIKYCLKNGDCLCSGKYEYETIEMLQKAFKNSRQVYDIDKVVEEKLRQCTNIENREYPYFNGFKEGKQLGYNKAIDDFVKMAYDELLYNEHLTEIDINYIAEQLKVGANNDKSI